MSTSEKDIINLGDGFLIAEDEKVSAFIDDLMEKGIFWEFLSILVTDYIKQNKSSASDNALLQVTEAFNELKDVKNTGKKQLESIEKVQNEVSLLTELVKKLSVSVNNGGNMVINQPSTLPTPHQEPEMKVIKAKPPKKGLGGGLGKAAAKMNSLNRK